MAEEAPKYLGSWKGRVIKAIAIDGAYTWNEIRDSTGLSTDKLKLVLREMFNVDAIRKIKVNEQTEYRVDKALYNEYKTYFEQEQEEKSAPVVRISEEVQKDLAKWIDQWKDLKKLKIDLNRRHFFLEGRFLDEFSKDVIVNAKAEVLVTNPWIRKCNLSETLREAKEKGVTVTVIMRKPDNGEDKGYHTLLKDEEIRLYNNESVHAKIIVIDRALAIISSMNFIVQSSGGQSWEAGLVTLDHNVVEEVVNSILKLIEKKESTEI